MSNQYKGWLQNPERRNRQQKSLAFTDSHVQELLAKIDHIPQYCKKSLGPEIDRLLRLRDRGLVGCAWIWFKRASEFLSVKRKDVAVTDSQILVIFTIKKKSKRFKLCPICETKSGYRAKFCKECKADLQNVEVQGEKGDFVVTKRKTLKNKFARHIIHWLEESDNLTEEYQDNSEFRFFPALQVVFESAYFKFSSPKPMTVQNFDHILQRLDPSITPSFFRYFATEKYLTLGYLPHELRSW